ncbi:3072bf9a-e4f2-41a4-ab33-cdf8d1aa1fac [Sclerotinia trifoliorum]|uniref:3072bf9a-e4f2-41a4-ab33-cdf8d1aa1fac n=1 Tax=Sclerotinia trifoliorum TaxID=28548 RepID=A0A8H2ZWU9_9HELO|nr:3072bf9a-e4f2-41a4-ab33-cdf8d1aa1fac [Sclerotinia trifoliorum]
MQSSRTIQREPFGNLIQDDQDFEVTHAYVLAARGGDPKDRPAAWKEPELIPAGTHDQTSKVDRPTQNQKLISAGKSVPRPTYTSILKHLEHNLKLREGAPGIRRRNSIIDPIDEESGLTIPTLNMARAIFFRWHSISEQECKIIAPPVIARLRRGDPELEDYIHDLMIYQDKVELEVLQRALDMTCSIVLANIHTDDFKERCRSNFGHLRLAMLFYNLVTDDELYYIFRTLWLAVDFSFVQCSDKLPDSPTDEDEFRWHLRKFTKLKFAHLAAYYFEQCLQQKSPIRHESMQPSKAERQAFASGLRRDMEKKEEELSKSQENENDNDAGRRHPPVDPKVELDQDLFEDPPEVVIHEDPLATPKAEDREIAWFNSEQAAEGWARGVMNVVDYWREPPFSLFIWDVHMLPATGNFLEGGGSTW